MNTLGTARVIHGNALNLPLEDNTVDLVVTSPPYFGLRSYQDAGEHYSGQLGSEATPAEFVDALIAATAEMMRVVKPSGSIFVNLGDKYAGSGGPNNGNSSTDAFSVSKSIGTRNVQSGGYPKRTGIPAKSLMGIPWRYALACIDDLGLILRAEIIWSKCLSGGTRVYAEVKGRQTVIRLHDLCRHYQPADVRLWTGTKWSQVKSWESVGRSDAQYEVELRSGERIGSTAEHRWPTQRGLVRSDALTPGDIIDTAPLPDGGVFPLGLDDEMVGWFVGLYIAEGSRSEQTIQFAGHIKENERFHRLTDIANAFHGTARVHATGGNSATINMTGPILRAILETYVGGRTAKDKFLKPKCWQRSNVFLRSLLNGYLAGDGSWEEDLQRWKLGFTDNDALADDLRTLAARIGVSLRLQRVAHYGFGQQWPGWGGTLYTDPTRRMLPDSQVTAIRSSRARQFWDVEIEDEPHLFALASGVLTHNSNGLPESVTDRVRRSHEQWFHFTLQPRYYSAVDEVREAHTHKANGAVFGGTKSVNSTEILNRTTGNNTYDTLNPLGKLPGSVWTVPTQPLTVPPELGVDHFAAFPMEWPRRIITGWSPREVCSVCGEGRRPVTDRSYEKRATHSMDPANKTVQRLIAGNGNAGSVNGTFMGALRVEITGYACACPDTSAPTTPGVVLDPFGGTGTTALMAKALGRDGISVDLSEDYCRLARWRTTDPAQLAAALQVDKPAPVDPDQLDLFGEVSA